MKSRYRKPVPIVKTDYKRQQTEIDRATKQAVKEAQQAERQKKEALLAEKLKHKEEEEHEVLQNSSQSPSTCKIDEKRYNIIKTVNLGVL